MEPGEEGNHAFSRKIMQDKIINQFIAAIDPLMDKISEIYLFGSRCRDDWRPDSDYDFLIVLEQKDREVISKLYDAVMDILLDNGKLLSLKIFTIAEFNRLKALSTPFIRNILEEGIDIGKHVQRTH